jgi:hypothetical protein
MVNVAIVHVMMLNPTFQMMNCRNPDKGRRNGMTDGIRGEIQLKRSNDCERAKVQRQDRSNILEFRTRAGRVPRLPALSPAPHGIQRGRTASRFLRPMTKAQLLRALQVENRMLLNLVADHARDVDALRALVAEQARSS